MECSREGKQKASLTPVSNEINACGVSGVYRAKPARGSSDRGLNAEAGGDVHLLSVWEYGAKSETQEKGKEWGCGGRRILQLLFTAMRMETRKYRVKAQQASQ